jgi:hypothetical protein
VFTKGMMGYKAASFSIDQVVEKMMTAATGTT